MAKTNKPAVKTEVKPKEEVNEIEKANEEAKADMAVAAEVKEEKDLPIVTTAGTKPEDLRVDATITNSEVDKAVAASKAAAEAKAKADAEKAEMTAALRGRHVDNKAVQNVYAGESRELVAAVKEDAEKRGKQFSVCPISGVLVVS